MIGLNIRSLRKQKGFNLRNFAKKVNVSASFISQLEVGKINPSLAKLKDIASALNTTVGALIGENDKPDNQLITRENDRKHSDHIGEGMKVHLLTSPDQYKQMEPLFIAMDAGATSGDHQYQHFGQEFVLILKGKCEITLNDTKYILNKGDSIYFNSNIPHFFKNISKTETDAIWVITPPGF
jgi:transcriptional regulator with XRE-family HTH domain